MVLSHGIEPQLIESKSIVLPLDEERIWCGGWELNPQRIQSQCIALPLSYLHRIVWVVAKFFKKKVFEFLSKYSFTCSYRFMVSSTKVIICVLTPTTVGCTLEGIVDTHIKPD